jgi:hypothetical protein
MDDPITLTFDRRLASAVGLAISAATLILCGAPWSDSRVLRWASRVLLVLMAVVLVLLVSLVIEARRP